MNIEEYKHKIYYVFLESNLILRWLKPTYILYDDQDKVLFKTKSRDEIVKITQQLTKQTNLVLTHPAFIENELRLCRIRTWLSIFNFTLTFAACFILPFNWITLFLATFIMMIVLFVIKGNWTIESDLIKLETFNKQSKQKFEDKISLEEEV